MFCETVSFCFNTGSGATGVGRNCDFLAEALSVINSETVVKCVLDGPPDMAPVWLQQSLPQEQCEGPVSRFRTVESANSPNLDPFTLQLESERLEDSKFLWGRQDDDSCMSSLKDELNSTALALSCGSLSRLYNK